MRNDGSRDQNNDVYLSMEQCSIPSPISPMQKIRSSLNLFIFSLKRQLALIDYIDDNNQPNSKLSKLHFI